MGKTPRYLQIVHLIREKIEKGEWVVGSKIPTQRAIAEQFHVNRSTVVTAIEILKAEGLLEGRAGSGVYIVNNQWSLSAAISPPNWDDLAQWSLQPPSNHTVQLINELENRKDLIQLSKGELGPDLFPQSEISEALAKVSGQLHGFGYGNGLGDSGLRAEISKHMEKYGLSIAPESILIVSGALQALTLITIGILKKGSAVFLEIPSYLHSVNLFRTADITIKPVAVTKNGLDMKELFQQKITKGASALYVNPTYQNPTGTTMSTEQRQQLMEKCRYFQLPVIEDDIFRDLWIDEPAPAPLKTFDQAGQVLYVGSFSKTIAPGLRIGWLAGPEDVIHRLSDVRMQTDYGSSYLSQVLIRELLRSGLYEQHLQKVRSRLRERRAFLLQALALHLSEYATWHAASGGFFIWVTLKKKINMYQLFKACLSSGVLINPGFIYNESGPSIRLSYAYEEIEKMEAGIIKLKDVLKDHLNR
ncbi:PLP-dependent aminotransferase family protein [Bacillus badius]|uniref:Aspartate aminotransferase n=1 Tax=Bacillus badius TaxID=1455 RepID=A0ABR5AUZ9_BACBA|nr:PLP-dependent aminotransferase family protein [Bacillus badius]KIL72785.1 Aspartate aminotransferase [Bacillus badius]KIL78196.1 Aspartate aminotransferase [Bacillus badius]MED4718315.1 PLP-dependent aminotransferase family protein [Bacillus badius]